jgi:trigger factor
MSFDAAFDVEPAVEITRYTGFRVEKKMQKVDDGSVDGVLERLRKEKAVTQPVERPAEKGDLVSIEYLMSEEDGTPISGESKKEFDVNLGDGGVVEEIENNIIGMSAGEHKEVTVTYPDDYFAEKLRGTTKMLSLTVKDVRKVEIAPLDDEFAKSVEPSKDLASLRDDIKQRLTEEVERNARNEVIENLIDHVIEANPFEAPRIIVDSYLDEFLERMRQERQRAGEDFDPEKVREPYRPAAVRAFKKRFIVNAIAKSENLAATADDVEKELESFSKGMNRPIESLRKELEKEPSTKENFKSEITLRKVAHFLIENSDVREKYE